MVSKSECMVSGPRSFPRRGGYELAKNLLKTSVRRDGRPNVVLECFNCRWEVGEVQKVGG